MLRRRRRSEGNGYARDFARVEVHEFEGELYVTDGWTRGSGEQVLDPSDDRELGRIVRSRLRAQRTELRPFIASLTTRQRAENQWARFCRDAARTTPSAYRPERRVVVLSDDEGLRSTDGSVTPVEWAPLDGESEEALGNALRLQLSAIPARWPTAASALAAQATDRLLVYPQRGIFSEPPIATTTSNDTRALGGLILDALAASGTLVAQGDLDRPSHEFEGAVRRLGSSLKAIDTATKVGVRRPTVGPLRVGFILGDREEEVPDHEPDLVGAAVMSLLSRRPTGVPMVSDPRAPAFGPKVGWIAARSSSESLLEALGLTDMQVTALDEGVRAAYDSGVFVLPPVDGWVLAVGADILTCEVDVAALSADLVGPVQLFRTHRVVELHEWALAEGGTLVRRLRYVGESGELEETGTATEPERILGLHGSDVMPSESDLFELARRWSLDPTHLDERTASDPQGVFGRLPAPRGL